jgi:CDP-glucose 4,6-dehydratase
VRPWQHVLEPLGGYLLLAMKMAEDPDKYSGAWNFGPEENDLASVKDVVDLLLSLWGTGRWESENKSLKLHEAGLLRLNINKSKDKLGRKPILDFNETVQWTVQWYKAYKACDVYQLCVDQIERYINRWNSKS